MLGSMKAGQKILWKGASCIAAMIAAGLPACSSSTAPTDPARLGGTWDLAVTVSHPAGTFVPNGSAITCTWSDLVLTIITTPNSDGSANLTGHYIGGPVTCTSWPAGPSAGADNDGSTISGWFGVSAGDVTQSFYLDLRSPAACRCDLAYRIGGGKIAGDKLTGTFVTPGTSPMSGPFTATRR